MKRVRSFFPTLVHCAPLMRGAASLNAELLRECDRIRAADAAGRRWSRRNYPGGYTSYGSLDQLHRMTGTFIRWRAAVDRHVRSFARALHWDLGGRRLAMTDCWLNVMGPGCTHGSHVHPQSVVSGTYYLRVPSGAAGLKFEDPRLAMFMAAPARRANAPPAARHHVTVPARAGQVVLFESWLRHEVGSGTARGERVSLSFNYAVT